MKASELRIGNWVKRNGLVVQCDYMSAANCHGIPIQYEPIPITEEWLVRFGGKENNEEITIAINRHLYISFIDSECELVTDDDFLIMDINHVHQLQNLYFALTGEELELK